MTLAYSASNPNGAPVGQVCGKGTLPGTVRILTAQGYATVQASSVRIVTVR